MRTLKHKLLNKADDVAASFLEIPPGGQAATPPQSADDPRSAPPSSVLPDDDISSDDTSWGAVADDLDGAEDELKAAVPPSTDEPPAASSKPAQPAQPVQQQQPTAARPQGTVSQDDIDRFTEEFKKNSYKPMSQEEINTARETYKTHRDKARQDLMQYYAIPAEVADALVDNPAEVLPAMFAEMYLDMYEGLVRSMHELMPPIIQQQMHYTTTGNRVKEVFYNKWDKLRGHEATVERLGKAYIAANPEAEFKDFVNDVGIQAMVSLGLAVNGLQLDTAGVEVMSRQAPPVAPMGRRGNPSTPRAQPSQNAFTELSQLWEDDE